MAEKEPKNMTTHKHSKLGIIVRSDLGSGLQSQTYNLTRMLRPDRILHINSKPFNNREPNYDMYDGFKGFSSLGFPDNKTVRRFLSGLTHVLTAETFYSYELIRLANATGIKTFNQVNYEFCDHLRQTLPMPYLWLMPSHWYIEEMIAKFENVQYLPPPIFLNDFVEARSINMKRTPELKKFVHIVGKQAEHDRNGTEDLLRALEHCQQDFELVIRSQYPLPYRINDRRVTFDIGNKVNQNDLYADFDAMIIPRRYGGLCLPMNEALSSGLPVIMTDISPNNRLLPESWLAQAKVKMRFMTRTMIDCYQSDVVDLARVIDSFAQLNDEQLMNEKMNAFTIAYSTFNADVLKETYERVLEL